MYSQSESVSKINAKASGTDAVPCVKVRWPRATIHWYQTTDVKRGGLRIDGNSGAVDAVRHMLREAFPPPELMAASSEAPRWAASGRSPTYTSEQSLLSSPVSRPVSL